MTNSNETTGNRNNPWKSAVLTIGALLILLVAAFALANVLEEVGAASKTAAAEPSRAVVEDCNRYAAEATRDTQRLVKDGVVGGAIGAGLGAAGGAIADGGKGAGKGAGIGAIAGVAAGTLYGLNEENRRTDAARAAYQTCMARRGY
jgi:uncharacterized protein YcfJ